MDMKQILAEATRIGQERAKQSAAYTGPPLRFTFLGNDREADMPWLSHEEAAGTVRMLMRHQLDHEQVCCMARDRILHLAQENARLRAALTMFVDGDLIDSDWNIDIRAYQAARAEGRAALGQETTGSAIP